MKRFHGFVRLALLGLLACLALCLVGCGKLAAGGGSYDFVYEQEFTDPHDADMIIDGRFDEARWRDKTFLTHTQDGVTVRYTSTLTEMGVYFAAEAEDPSVKWTARLDFANNSCFTVFVTREGQRTMHPMRVLRFDIDSRNARSYNQNRFEAKAVVDGEVNGATQKMTAELFVSWDSLGIDVSGGIPASVRICPYYRKIVEADSADNKNIFATFTWTERPQNYLRFGAGGYLNPDAAGAKVGDGANGMVKSDGWDLTKEPEGVARSIAENSQAIFFKGVEATDFDLSATVRPVAAIHDGAPHVGLIALAGELNLRTFYLSASDILSGATTVRGRNLTLYPAGAWQENAYVSAPASRNGAERVRMIKRGAQFYYFIGDTLVRTEQVDHLAGAVVPGLFSLGCEAVFSDYEVTDYSSEADALDAVLADYIFTVDVPGYITGGSVTASSFAAVKNGPMTLDVAPRPGYALTSFAINGTDALGALRAGIDGGKYVIDAVTQNLTVTAAFTRLPSTVRVTGRLKTELGGTVPAASVSAGAEGDPLMFYRTGTAASGSFALDLAPAGEGFSGKYLLTFASDGLRKKTVELTLTEETDLGDITLSEAVLGGAATVGKDTFQSDTRGWDMSEEHLGAVTATGGSNGSKLFFTGVTGSRAVIDFTVENRTPDGEGYETSPGVGITFARGNRSLLVLILDSRLLILPSGVWEEGTFYDNTAGYDLRRKNEAVTFRFVKDDDMLCVLAVHPDGTATELYRGVQPLLAGECAFGLTVTQTFDCAVRVSDYAAAAGEAADGTAEALFYRAVSLADYDDALGTATLSHTGLTRIGTEITVRAETAHTALITAGGKSYLLEGGGACSFILAEDTAVGARFYETLCELTGSVTAADKFGTVDLSSAVVTVLDNAAGTELRFEGSVGAEGAYAVRLPAGDYLVTLSHPDFLPVTLPVTVAGDTTAAAAEFLSSALLSTAAFPGGGEAVVESAPFTVDPAAQTASVASIGRGEHNRKFFSAPASASLVAETTVSRIDRSDDDWAAAGFYLASASGGYGVYLCEPDGDGNVFLIVQGIDPWYVAFMRDGLSWGDDGSISLKLVLTGGRLYVFADGALALTLDSGSLASTRNAHTDSALTGTAFRLFPDGFFTRPLAAGLGTVAAGTVFTRPSLSQNPDYLAAQPVFATLAAVEEGCEIRFAYLGSGLPAPARVLLYDEIRVTVTAPEGKTVAAITAGEPLDLTYPGEGKRVATAVLTVTGDVTVSAYITDQAVPVSGSLSAPAAYGADLTLASVRAVDAAGFGYTLPAPDAAGLYAGELPPGEYTFTFTHPAFEDITLTASTGGGAIPGASFTLPRLSGEGWTISDGEVMGVTGQTRMFAGAEGATVMAEATVRTVTSTGAWSTGGVAVQTDLDGGMVELRILPLVKDGKITLLFINQAGGWGFRTYPTPYVHASAETPLSMRVVFSGGLYYVTLGGETTVTVGYDTPFAEQAGDALSRHPVFFGEGVKKLGLCVQDGNAAFTAFGYAAGDAAAALLPDNPFADLTGWHYLSGALVSPETGAGVNARVDFARPAAASFAAETTFRVAKNNGGWAAGGIYLSDGTYGLGVYVVGDNGNARLVLIAYGTDWDADSFASTVPYTPTQQLTLRVEFAGGEVRTFINGVPSETVTSATGVVSRKFADLFTRPLTAGLACLESQTHFTNYAYETI